MEFPAVYRNIPTHRDTTVPSTQTLTTVCPQSISTILFPLAERSYCFVSVAMRSKASCFELMGMALIPVPWENKWVSVDFGHLNDAPPASRYISAYPETTEVLSCPFVSTPVPMQ